MITIARHWFYLALYLLSFFKESLFFSKEFSGEFYHGVWDGFWWAFVTMTTVGWVLRVLFLNMNCFIMRLSALEAFCRLTNTARRSLPFLIFFLTRNFHFSGNSKSYHMSSGVYASELVLSLPVTIFPFKMNLLQVLFSHATLKGTATDHQNPFPVVFSVSSGLSLV